VTGPRPPIETRLAAANLPALPRTAWLEIDLDALRHNLDVLRRLAGPGVPILPVVKADAYGHGAVEIAQALEGAGVAGLCVATYDEAVQLRAAGILARILVLSDRPPGSPAASRGSRSPPATRSCSRRSWSRSSLAGRRWRSARGRDRPGARWIAERRPGRGGASDPKPGCA
jgi:hypothetical protein